MANNMVKLSRGTYANFQNLTKNTDTIYFLTGNKRIYMGDQEYARPVDDAFSETSDNAVSAKVIANKLAEYLEMSQGFANNTFLPLTGGTLTGTLTMGANLMPNANGTRNIGNSSRRWNVIYAKTFIGTQMNCTNLKCTDTITANTITGNTFSGNSATATKWNAPVLISVDLGKTSALSLQGGEDTSTSPLSIGITGILPVAQGGTGLSTLTAGSVLIGNGTNAVSLRAIKNNTTATKAGTGDSLITENTLFHALPSLNGDKNYTSSSSFFAPVTGGAADSILIANGDTSAPTWTTQASLSVGMAGKLASPQYIDGIAFDGSTDITHYGVCDTAKATAAKTVTVGGTFKLETGARVTVKFTYENDAATPTLNVNGTGAKAMRRYGSTKMSNSDTTSGWVAGAVMSFVYDGTAWIREYWNNTTYTITASYCTTAGDTAAKVGSSTYFTDRECLFELTIRYANTAASALTLNMNSTGAKPIYINGVASSATNYDLPAGKYWVYYDGANYYLRTDGFFDWKRSMQKVSVAGNDIYLGESLSADTLRTSLGLSNSMHFIGVATVAITDGSTTNPSISGYDFANNKKPGDVVIDKDSSYEYVWSTTGKWEKLGGDSSYKTTQTAVAKKGGTLPSVITSISQNANGVITVTDGQIGTLSINGKTYNGSAAIDVGTIGVGYGGTGVTSLTAYGLLMGNGSNAISTIAPADVGLTLVSKGSGAAPVWDDTLMVTSSGIAVTGEILLDNKAKFVYNSTDKCIDLIFI